MESKVRGSMPAFVPYSGPHSHLFPRKQLNYGFRRSQRFLRNKKAAEDLVPEKFSRYDEEFDAVVEFQSQLQALEARGFNRAYKPYTPPKDMVMKINDFLIQQN